MTEPPPSEESPPGSCPTVVAFDIGEVLVDESRVWSVWAEIVGVSSFTLSAVMGAAIAQGTSHEDAFEHLVPNVDWRELNGEHERRLGGLQAVDLYPDVVDCLDAVRRAGFRVVIAGNQPARRHEQLRRLGLPHDELVTSEQLGAEKPDPAFFAGLLDLADVAADQMLYVGDRVDNDVLPALDAGLRTCWLRRGPWAHLQEVPESATPDLVLEGLGELPVLLETWTAS